LTDINLGALPPDLNEPPNDARGWLAFQPSSGKVWWKISGQWLSIDEALKHIEERP